MCNFIKGNSQKRELPVLFWPKTSVPECNSSKESCWSYLILVNTHFHLFLAKNDRVLPIIATLLSFHPFLTILCPLPVGYSNRPECFNDWWGRGYDDSFPGEVAKTTPSVDKTM